MPDLGAASVGGSLADGPEEERLLHAVALALAEQHDLTCAAEIRGGAMTIRFAHPRSPLA